jgi:hypothetical protein
MKRICLLAVGALLLVSNIYAKYHIVIVAGQSNCLNIHTSVSELPESVADSLIPFFYELYYPPSGVTLPLVTSSDNCWETLHYHMREGSVGPTYPFFGPEMILGRTLAETLDSVAIFKFGVAGSNLGYEWNPESTTGVQIFKAFMDKLHIAEQKLRDRGDDFEWYAFTWMQGEGDAIYSNYAAAYYTNLGRFFQTIRDTLNQSDLPVVFGLIADELPLGTYPYRDTVRKAQIRFANDNPDVTMINTAAYPMDTDNVHFNSEGVMQLGNDMAAAIVTLKSGSSATRSQSSKRSSPNPLVIFPNPANNMAQFTIIITDRAPVKLDLYDINGRHVQTIMQRTCGKGKLQVAFSTADLPSGLYFLSLNLAGRQYIRKLNIVK